MQWEERPHCRPPQPQQSSSAYLSGRVQLSRWCVRWAPTPLNPPPSGRRAGECAMRAATRRRQADTQRPLSQESGGTGVPSSDGGDDAKVPRKGSIEQVSRSVFAARGSPASGAGGVS